jgi:hypothetical protein
MQVDYFEILGKLSAHLLEYEPEGTTITDFSYLLTAGVSAMHSSLPYYNYFEDPQPYYELWHDAMNRNMGNSDPFLPFDGVMNEMNDGYVAEVDKFVQNILANPDDRQLMIDLTVLLEDPIRVYAGIDSCMWASLRMQRMRLPSDLIPDVVSMQKALAHQQLYKRMFSDVAKTMSVLTPKQLETIEYIYLKDTDKRIPYVKFLYWVPKKAERFIIADMPDAEDMT